MTKKHPENTKDIGNITQDLAEFIASTNYNNLPESVVNQAKLCFLDFLSVSLGGSQTKSVRIIRNIFNGNGKGIESEIREGTKFNEPLISAKSNYGKSTVIGWNKLNPLDAALANGVSAHSLDLDDGHRLAQLHPGACIIPAALALSEAHEKSGKEFINAMVVGYQVAIQLGMILNPQHRNKGFHTTGTCGTLGAAAAASKIMELDLDGILNALGLAGTQAAGLLESDHSGSMGKHLHAGKAAQSGILSALLALEGMTGAHNILEGKEGLLKAMGSLENLGENAFLKNNLAEYQILGVYFKKYPVCRHLHSSIDAIINIMNNNRLNPADIKCITVETYEIASSHNNYQPKTLEGIRQSLPLSIAIALKQGSLNFENILTVENNSINYLEHEKIWEIAAKVRIKLDNSLSKLYPQKRPSRVTIKLGDNIYTERVDLAKGEPENPFSKNELLNKFRELNHHVDINCLKILDDLEDEHLTEVMNGLNQEFKKI